MSHPWILAVRTTVTESLELDFDDRGLLEAQLARFDKRGLGDPYHLHEFNNGRGAVIAFISKAYVSHRVNQKMLGIRRTE